MYVFKNNKAIVIFTFTNTTLHDVWVYNYSGNDQVLIDIVVESNNGFYAFDGVIEKYSDILFNQKVIPHVMNVYMRTDTDTDTWERYNSVDEVKGQMCYDKKKTSNGSITRVHNYNVIYMYKFTPDVV